MVEGTRSGAGGRGDARRHAGHGEDTKRSVKEGVGFGLIAGAVFAAVWMLASAAAGQSPVAPLRMAAGVVFGTGALDFGAGTAVIAGVIVGAVLSALFGLIYGLINSRIPLGSHTSWGTQAVLGLIYGAVVWLVMIQIIARIAWPWFLDANQLLQFVLHTVFFGLPLALMYAASERRALLHPRRHRAAAQPT
jgi:hypothetical protein